MMDVLDQASAWLEQQRTRFASRTVSYRRGEESIQLPASIGKTDFELDDGAGAVIRVQSRDYLICAADLQLGDDLVLPQRGDRIIETDADGGSFEYEVMGPSADQPCWRYSDSYRRTLRVHTKQVPP